MTPSQIALQLYTLRDHCKNSTEFANTLRRVREIGYPAVEMVRLDFLSYQEIRKITDDSGLRISSIHENTGRLLDAPERVIDEIRVLGTNLAVYPYPRDIRLDEAASVRNLVERLGRSAAKFAEAGSRLAYHNHAIEFARHDGELVLTTILKANPQLQAELDTYWVQFGGGNILEWIESLHGRLPLLHLKDYQFDPIKNQPRMAELGQGNLDWSTILAAGDGAKVEWFVVEQDYCAGDPFDSIRVSYEFLCGLKG
jgi:sugar phosphate isomerase/epimerase